MHPPSHQKRKREKSTVRSDQVLKRYRPNSKKKKSKLEDENATHFLRRQILFVRVHTEGES